MHFGALLTCAYLPLLTSEKNSELFSHRSGAFWYNGSAAGHSDFICGSARTVLLYANINRPKFQRLYCWHTCYCPFVAVLCLLLYWTTKVTAKYTAWNQLGLITFAFAIITGLITLVYTHHS